MKTYRMTVETQAARLCTMEVEAETLAEAKAKAQRNEYKTGTEPWVDCYYDDADEVNIYKVRDDYEIEAGPCPTCGNYHLICENPDCGNSTHCPPDEPGEPFILCDACEAEEVNLDS